MSANDRLRAPCAVAFLAGALAWALFSSGVAKGEGGPPTFADVIRRSDPAIAHVTMQLAGDRQPGSRDDSVAAGFVFDPAGYVLTSRHGVQGARRIFVTLLGRGAMEARLVGADEMTDVAVLKVDAVGLPTLPVGDPRALSKGDWVLAAGSPFRLARSWSAGIVSGLDRSGLNVGLEGYEDYIQTDAASNVGNSGGPLLDARGAVVGMMTLILSRTGRSEGVALAVPIDVVLPVARALARGEPVTRPSLGVVVRETDVRGTGEGGLEITRFQPGSRAPAAGLQAGDVIVAVDDTTTTHVADLQRALWRRSPGDAVRIVFVRAGRRFQTTVRVD